MENKEEFQKIINDFTKDLATSFPELDTMFSVIDYDVYYDYCKGLYPENFFHILYENMELFDDEEGKYMLPQVDFKKIMEDESLSEKSKKTIWKYLQLILFCVCNDLKNKDQFGDATKLFEAINEDDLHSKIEDTMNEMKNIFMKMNEDGDCSFENMFENMMGDVSNIEDMFNRASVGEENISGGGGGNMFENMMDPDKMKEHLNGILDGKIGGLAKEIAEEASKELGIDQDNMDESSQQDFLKNLFKDPTKLMDIVKNIGSKLEEKFKNGDIKESELLEEAQEIMGKMKDMPGLKEMMSSMGMNPGGKMDFKGMANKMQQNMKQAKMKERMKAKLEKNNELKLEQNTSLGSLKEVNEDTFVWNDENSSTTMPKQSSAPKKKKGKKNKGKKKK